MCRHLCRGKMLVVTSQNLAYLCLIFGWVGKPTLSFFRKNTPRKMFLGVPRFTNFWKNLFVKNSKRHKLTSISWVDEN